MALQLELDRFISGERFQALADISLIPLGSEVGEKEFYFVKEQQKNNNYKVFYYDENTKSLPDEVHSARTLFVNTWTLRKFFNIVFPLLKNNHVFISHNSDMALEPEHVIYLDDKRVIRWFSQNAYLQHPKLVALPIGLGNQQYPHGNLQLLNSLVTGIIEKNGLVFKNFDVNTNRAVRSKIDVITSQNGIMMSFSMKQDLYFKMLSSSVFCISPPGNGVDCHRIWECLYLKTIPIVEYHPGFIQFQHLPILFIKDWNEVTISSLRSKINMMHRFFLDIKELNMQYWKQLIYDYY